MLLDTGTSSFGNTGMIKVHTGNSTSGHGGDIQLLVGSGDLGNGGDAIVVAGNTTERSSVGGRVVISAGSGTSKPDL